MKYRFVLALLLLPAAAGLIAVQGTAVATRSYMQEASSQANTALRLAVAALSGHLNRYQALPALIADHDDVKELVTRPRDRRLRGAVNSYLKEINELLKSSDIYVITPDGNTIAASNYDGPTSFVGENFSYRPYFQDALKGDQSRFYALGTTSLKRGYYFGAPVRVGGEIRGVIVFKVDIETIEASWQGGEYRIFVSDPEGIIFMSGNPAWLYAGILPLTPDRLARTEGSRRYADARLRPLPAVQSERSGHRLLRVSEGSEREYLALSHYMPEADWTVNVLTDTASVRTQALTTVAAVMLLLCLAALAIAIIIQRRTRLRERILMQEQAQEELERRVEERTADLARVNSQIEAEIAERRLTEQQLRQTQADLIQAGKLAGLGQMSAALSHEFNQPLAAAKTYADSAALLIERGRTAEASDNIRRISGLIDRMASISRHLRNFARKPNEKLGPVRLDEVVRDTLEIVEMRLKAAGAEMDIDIGDELAVLAGSVRLQQVLVNVISNAADAVEGLDDRKLSVRAWREGGRAVLTVRDRGAGVAPAVAQRIFDPFYTTKGVGRGLGLGLSISYNIIKDFGGSLTVSNHSEGGAVFRIELALAGETGQEAAE
ncbi:sensor histidine kinase [Sinorhizobium meliloti]|uniref:sensor histidine kinase n=1 Tax=Rhizobium meliloti TaxID=382 RepID=UPI000FDB4BFD|nr:sensor histidine kinase [Sinorhizobium meliloti]TWA97763.1 two-component system C4-dicarboxylate transport sensor histidine kinase DctB [Ensifer sp. SEMIA 134]TWB41600.1 two-component system C4-dicarboxylate transport sensor histidine kinase DctB [Ensifer sp. SEMIA 135]MDW9678810.1 two-component sensor histidine kinase [Sinorhizobium meliloti]MDW9691271.1 two-component sensor histidine kinase [Sinorhizobium meliloti]MDW9716466.1 two-component sensor histidine kinase [Sinorhizobium meliloti]